MYAAGSPASDAFSGRPCPFTRWQKPHARICGLRPWATASGIGGCAEGNQSGGLFASRVCATVSDTLLPAICRGAGSTGAGAAPGVGGGFTV